MWLWPAYWRWTSAISTLLRGASKASRSSLFTLLHQWILFSQIIFCMFKLATNVGVWTENVWGLGGIKTIQNIPRAPESTVRWGKQFICIWWFWHVQYVGLSHDSSPCWEAVKWFLTTSSCQMCFSLVFLKKNRAIENSPKGLCIFRQLQLTRKIYLPN